jgi:hypothetical protein
VPQNPIRPYSDQEVMQMAGAKERGKLLPFTPERPLQPLALQQQPGLVTRALAGLKGLFGGLQNEAPPPQRPGRDIYLPLGPGDTIDPRLKG